MAGQFRPGSGPDGGTERLIEQIGLDVAYAAAPTDDSPPVIEQVAAVNTASATIVVRAREDAPGGVRRVGALYTDGTAGQDGTLTWSFAERTLDSALGAWTATLPAAGPIQVIAMAQNANGLVAYSTNKGGNFPSVTDTTGPEVLVEAPAPAPPTHSTSASRSRSAAPTRSS